MKGSKFFPCLLLLFLAVGAGAETLLPDNLKKKFDEYKGRSIWIQAVTSKGYQTLNAYNGTTSFFTTRRSTMGEQLASHVPHPPLLFLFWGSGVHGEMVVVLDTNKNQKVYEQKSGWPIGISKKNGNVRLVFSESETETLFKDFDLSKF